ncbi:MAG: serine hydrolase [Saprospiraceae bacterium]|nr:serine hydrolase [Saprospiraceae bacterium]
MRNFLLVLGLWATGTVANAQTTFEQLDELLTAYANSHQFNGTALVMNRGVLVLQKGYGLRNVTEETKNNAHTVFQIGSVTKQFTALVILKLAEQGKLKLTDPVSRFFPDYPKGEHITIHHLLTHTSGIYNYTDNGAFIQSSSSKPASRETMMALFKDQPTQFAPGSDWAYSNSGYLLLGYIIEKVTQQPYEQAVRALIFKPLGMKNSGFNFAGLSTPNKAVGYISIQENHRGISVDSTVSYAGGAIYSTTDDLLKWHEGLLKNTLVKRATLAKAFTPYKNQYGYGWVIDSFVGKKGVYHNGSIMGFTSNIYRIEEDNVCIVLLGNSSTSKIDELTKGLLSVLYNKPYSIPREPKAIAVSSEVVRQYLGTYEFTPQFHAAIQVVNHQVYAGRVGETQKHLLVPIAPHRFFIKDVDQELEFVGNEHEGFNKAILHTGGEPMVGTRIAPYEPTLADTIAALDKALFEAFNRRDLEKLLGFFSEELEFFHDIGGLSNYEANKKAFEENFKANRPIRRELVEASLEVYPVPNYGAIQVGEHVFCHMENGTDHCSTLKFVHVWQKKNGQWKITRVVSFAH